MFKLTPENKWRYILSAYALIFAAYFFNNQFQVFEVRALEMTPLDKAIPYWPWTGWIYIWVYFFPLLVVFGLKHLENLQKALLCGVLSGFVCNLVFFFYPTAYPRPLEPLEGFIHLPLWIVHQLDRPTNCFPSAHVAFAFLAAFIIYVENKKRGVWLLGAAVLISISTLTTKQHYFWDVVAGYVIARVTSAFVFHRLPHLRGH